MSFLFLLNCNKTCKKFATKSNGNALSDLTSKRIEPQTLWCYSVGSCASVAKFKGTGNPKSTFFEF